MATEYVGNYYKSIIAHYDMAGDRLKGTKGYEFYSKTVQANQDDLDVGKRLQFGGVTAGCTDDLGRTGAAKPADRAREAGRRSCLRVLAVWGACVAPTRRLVGFTVTVD
ncbi:MAG: hypothetical protein AB7I59_22720 [Geminicoccaceae bacterium]